MILNKVELFETKMVFNKTRYNIGRNIYVHCAVIDMFGRLLLLGRFIKYKWVLLVDSQS